MVTEALTASREARPTFTLGSSALSDPSSRRLTCSVPVSPARPGASTRNRSAKAAPASAVTLTRACGEIDPGMDALLPCAPVATPSAPQVAVAAAVALLRAPDSGSMAPSCSVSRTPGPRSLVSSDRASQSAPLLPKLISHRVPTPRPTVVGAASAEAPGRAQHQAKVIKRCTACMAAPGAVAMRGMLGSALLAQR